MIKPTVGRVVWFKPSDGDIDIACGAQPLAAHVCYVWDDRMVNLLVIDVNGATHARTSVRLLQDDDVAPEGSARAWWMPYQKGQAAKTEALEARAAGASS